MKRQRSISDFFGGSVKRQLTGPQIESATPAPIFGQRGTSGTQEPVDADPTPLAASPVSSVDQEACSERSCHNEANKLDIGLYVGVAIDNNLRFKLLTSCWIPQKDYTFPVVQQGSTNRRFKASYLDTFKPWLAWSHVQEGAFCRYCVLFATDGAGKGAHQALGILVLRPLIKLKDIISDCRCHEQARYHKESIERAEGFIRLFEGKTVDVLAQMDATWKQQAQENRKRLVPIIETVHHCGKQGLALRAHRDHGQLSLEDPGFNDGNFRASLRFRLQAGDTSLKWHLTTCSKNATFISWNIQNQIITATGEIMRADFVRDINAAPFFSVICDGTTDVALKEQMSIVIRYVKDNCLHESFLGFVELKSTTGEATAAKILGCLEEYGLDLKKMRGQAYDGCAAMKGYKSGAQAVINRRFPKALYMQCSSHTLNLVVAQSAKVQEISNCIGTIKDITHFLRGSAKRMSLFKEKLDLHVTECVKKTLSSLSETRWVERHETVVRFVEMFPAVLATLEDMEEWSDSVAASKSSQFLSALTNHCFLVALCTCARFSGLLLPLSRKLQDPYIDLIECVEQVNDVKLVLQRCRGRTDVEFNAVFKQAEELVQEPIRVPRKAGRQIDDPQTYYRQSIFIPYIDGLIQQLNDRFGCHVQRALKLQQLVPSHVPKARFEDLVPTFNDYVDDLSCTPQEIKDEFERWQIKWNKCPLNERPRNAVDSLITSLQDFYPNITKLLILFVTLPITTASAERSFSCLKRLKSYLRSTMGQDRLTGLAMMEMNRKALPCADAIINKLAAEKRRLDIIL